MSSGRACVSAAIVVPSGTSPSSITSRVKSKSVFEAEGKPTSISGMRSASRRSKKRRLRAESIGLTSAWFPSRRSVEHQMGARSTTRSGHVRSGRSTVSYGRYFQCGMDIGGRSFSGRGEDAPRVRTGSCMSTRRFPYWGRMARSRPSREAEIAGRSRPAMRARYPTSARARKSANAISWRATARTLAASLACHPKRG